MRHFVRAMEPAIGGERLPTARRPYEMAHIGLSPGDPARITAASITGDVLTGVYAFGAISAALYQRHGTRKGQHIDVSMLESMLSLTLNECSGRSSR